MDYKINSDEIWKSSSKFKTIVSAVDDVGMRVETAVLWHCVIYMKNSWSVIIPIRVSPVLEQDCKKLVL